jgi:predicted O-linked N-acetylglucosamine transferase (SPINDLY family)
MPFGPASIQPVAAACEGRRTSGFLVTSEAGRARPAVVAIAGAFRETWELFPTALALCGEFDILFVDMPGINGTGPAESASVEIFARHVVDLVATELGRRDLLLLGESLGGPVALEAAANLGANSVRGIALVDSPLTYPAQLRVRAYWRDFWHAPGRLRTPLVDSYIDGNGVVRDADPDAYLNRLRAAGASASVLVLSGGRHNEDLPGAPACLVSIADEAEIAACGLGDLFFVRLLQAGHVVLAEVPNAAHNVLLEFFRERLAPSKPRLAPAAAAFARAPHDAALRDDLLAALRAKPTNSRRSQRDTLLAILTANPDDGELLVAILEALYDLPDAQGLAAIGEATRRASSASSILWAAMPAVSTLFRIGDADAALGLLRMLRFEGDMPQRLSYQLLHHALYAMDADDRSVAAAKEKNFRNIRNLLAADPSPPLPAPPPRAATVASGARPRIGLVSAFFGNRNYTSLMLPLLRELSNDELDIALLSLSAQKLDHVRAVLPDSIAVRELDLLPPDAIDRPDVWRRANAALRAQNLDLLVDLDESLAPYSTACVIERPARVQATWFNMSGPSLDPCFDAAIGPDTLYPRELDAAFGRRLARLPGDLYVFEPEAWAEQGVAFPDAGPPPMLKNGYPTFGSLSNVYKISDACIALWAKVLRAVPRARLYLGNEMAAEPLALARLQRLFAREGIDLNRIDICYHFGWPNYLAGYRRIDIVLGTCPVAGGTTMYEALHMGMPVLSPVGRTSLGRIGLWLQAATGRAGLAHESDESFVAEAVRLAAAPDELVRLRRDEPARLRAKSAIDAARMARAFEGIVRDLVA